MSPVIFLGAIFASYVAVNFYMLMRLYATLSGTGVVRGLSCALLLLLALAFPVGRILHDKLPQVLAESLIVVGSLYFAPMIYGLLFTLCADILRILNGILSITPLPPPFTVSGRVRVVCVVTGLSLTVTLLGALNALFPAVVRHDISWAAQESVTSDAVSGDAKLKIALLSDIHYGRLVGPRLLKSLFKIVRDEAPDILLFAGDVMDDMEWALDDRKREQTSALFSEVSPRLGSWAVNGNHEFYAGLDECVEFLTGSGVTVLRDEWATPGGELILVGREDSSVLLKGGSRQPLEDIARDIDSADPEYRQNLPLIVLDHQPSDLSEAERAGAALQLSGHTHRGQLFPINFVVSMIYEKFYGLSKSGKTHYYISSGAGTWGPPVRTTGRPEVVIITLDIKRVRGVIQ